MNPVQDRAPYSSTPMFVALDSNGAQAFGAPQFVAIEEAVAVLQQAQEQTQRQKTDAQARELQQQVAEVAARKKASKFELAFNMLKSVASLAASALKLTKSGSGQTDKLKDAFASAAQALPELARIGVSKAEDQAEQRKLDAKRAGIEADLANSHLQQLTRAADRATEHLAAIERERGKAGENAVRR